MFNQRQLAGNNVCCQPNNASYEYYCLIWYRQKVEFLLSSTIRRTVMVFQTNVPSNSLTLGVRGRREGSQ